MLGRNHPLLKRIRALRRDPALRREEGVVVAEGLTQYLAPDAVRDLFLQCGLVTGVGSRFAFTYIGARDDGRPDAGPWTRFPLWLLKATFELVGRSESTQAEVVLRVPWSACGRN